MHQDDQHRIRLSLLLLLLVTPTLRPVASTAGTLLALALVTVVAVLAIVGRVVGVGIVAIVAVVLALGFALEVLVVRGEHLVDEPGVVGLHDEVCEVCTEIGRRGGCGRRS